MPIRVKTVLCAACYRLLAYFVFQSSLSSATSFPRRGCTLCCKKHGTTLPKGESGSLYDNHYRCRCMNLYLRSRETEKDLPHTLLCRALRKNGAILCSFCCKAQSHVLAYKRFISPIWGLSFLTSIFSSYNFTSIWIETAVCQIFCFAPQLLALDTRLVCIPCQTYFDDSNTLFK